MTRLLAALSVLVAFALAGCGDRGGVSARPLPSPHPPSGTPTRADLACRATWHGDVQTSFENGNPRGTLHALRARWDRYQNRAKLFAAQASSADCGKVHSQLIQEWVRLGVVLAPEDEAVFTVLRRETPRAIADLHDVLDEAAAVDLSSTRAITAYEKRVAEVMHQSKHARRAYDAADRIDAMTLDEE